MTHPVYDPSLCSICKRRLGQAGDLLSANCGGDCLACMIEIEDGQSAPELPGAQLELWIELRNAVETKVFDAMGIGTEKPLLPAGERIVEQDVFMLAWARRFVGLGLDDDAAWTLVCDTINTVLR